MTLCVRCAVACLCVFGFSLFTGRIDLLFFLKGNRGDRASTFMWTPALGEIGMGDR